MSVIRPLGAGLLALACVGLLLRGGLVIAMPGLLFVLSLALAGQGNRWLWVALFPLVSAGVAMALGGLGWGLRLAWPASQDLVLPLLGFAAMPIAPALVLGAAVKFKRLRGD